MPRRKKLIESSSESSSNEDSDELSELSDSGDSDQDSNNESRVFCKCRQPNTVDMIGCDRKDCQYEWFHFTCVGIDRKKVPKGKWFCEDCVKKQEAEDPRIPSGPFVYPDTNNREQKNSSNEPFSPVEDIATKDIYILPTPGNPLKKKGYFGTTIAKSSMVSLTDTNANNKNFTAAVENTPTDTTLKQSLMQESLIQHSVTQHSITQQSLTQESLTQQTLTQHSLSQAEQQHESNLKEACKYVIHNGVSVIDAAKQFGVGRYTLGDCVKDELKVNLNKACDNVLRGKMTIEKAASVYGVIPGILNDRVKAEKDILQTMHSEHFPNKLVSTKVQEENLQQACMDVMSMRMTVNEACKCYKIKLQSLKNKIQSVFVLSTAEENDLVRLSVRMAVLGHTAHIKSTVFAKVKSLLDEEEANGIKRIHWFPDNTPTDMWWQVFCSRHPEFNAISINESKQMVGSNTISPSGGQPTDLSLHSNNDRKTSSQEGQPSTENLFYVLPTAVNSTPQFVVVRQDNLDSPVVKSDGVNDRNDFKMIRNQDSENFVIDLSLKAANFDNSQVMEDPMLGVAACEVVQEDILVPSTSEMDQMIVGANEEVLPDTDEEDKDNGAHNNRIVNSSSMTTSEQPDSAVLQDGFILGANEVIQTGEEMEEVEGIQSLTTNAPTAQPSLSVDGDTPRSKLVAATTGSVPSSPSIKTNVLCSTDTQSKRSDSTTNHSAKGEMPRLMVCTNQVKQPGQVIYQSDVIQPNYLISKNKINQKQVLVTSKDGIKHSLVLNQSPGASGDTNNQNKLRYLSLAEFQSKKLNQPIKYILSRTPVAGQAVSSTEPTPLNMNDLNSSSNISWGKNSKMFESYTERKAPRMFVAKHNVDQSMPDALSCLEKTLTKEQKESFMFRLKIGDNSEEDLRYNAWKALMRLYHHTDICSLYDKVSRPTLESPDHLDTPIASKLLRLPLMAPSDEKESNKKAKQDSSDVSRLLGELHQGRKRRRITSVLTSREAKRRKWQTKKKMFLEPWKYKMERPSRRKNIATSCCEDGFVRDKATDEISPIIRNESAS
ncbi:uncharacterized protein [Asterias amurensis]|uniref:uncharacterized protein n=1 Tax=Asterias amurensis TaxID=7602 RepID=UPI003AB13D95